MGLGRLGLAEWLPEKELSRGASGSHGVGTLRGTECGPYVALGQHVGGEGTEKVGGERLEPLTFQSKDGAVGREERHSRW